MKRSHIISSFYHSYQIFTFLMNEVTCQKMKVFIASKAYSFSTHCMKFSQWYSLVFISNISFVKVSLIFLTLQTMFTSLIFPFKVLPIENQEAVKDFLRFRLHIIWLLRQSWNVEGQICIFEFTPCTIANEWFPKYEWQGKKFQKKKSILA